MVALAKKRKAYFGANMGNSGYGLMAWCNCHCIDGNGELQLGASAWFPNSDASGCGFQQ